VSWRPPADWGCGPFGGLAVDVEPSVFWPGAPPADRARLVEEWRSRAEGVSGPLLGRFGWCGSNGSSGALLDDLGYYFSGSFCTAAKTNSSLAFVPLWSQQPQVGKSKKADPPTFAPLCVPFAGSHRHVAVPDRQWHCLAFAPTRATARSSPTAGPENLLPVSGPSRVA